MLQSHGKCSKRPDVLWMGNPRPGGNKGWAQSYPVAEPSEEGTDWGKTRKRWPKQRGWKAGQLLREPGVWTSLCYTSRNIHRTLRRCLCVLVGRQDALFCLGPIQTPWENSDSEK